jgi:L-ribulose-5-phosphate 3-epimerase
MSRRAFIKELGALCWSAPLAFAAADRTAGAMLLSSPFKLGAISDGFSQNFEEALEIMQGYGLSWVEIRHVFGVYNTEASPAQVKRLKDAVKGRGFRVSVIDSALYKCALPGTTPVKGENGNFNFAQQMDLLKRAMDRADALGCDKIRGFTFWRVSQPKEILPRIADELEKAAAVAARAKMRLVIENEESCNAGSAHELSAILQLAPAANLGVNWDVGNGYWQGEVSYPDGYHLLDKKRIWHMHLKGVTCAHHLEHCAETFADQGQVDLVGQFRALLKDGYQETMSLECEFEAPGRSHLETSKRSLEGLLRVASAAVKK